jgi:hypothetical protein
MRAASFHDGATNAVRICGSRGYSPEFDHGSGLEVRDRCRVLIKQT